MLPKLGWVGPPTGLESEKQGILHIRDFGHVAKVPNTDMALLMFQLQIILKKLNSLKKKSSPNKITGKHPCLSVHFLG